MTKAPATKHRPPLRARPWLRSGAYDLLTRDGVIHADIIAPELDLFVIEWRRGGRALLAVDVFRYGAGELERATLPPNAERALRYWARGTHDDFARAHRALLTYVRAAPAFPDERVRSIQCHYIRTPDASPFPRAITHTRRRGPSVLPDLL